MLTPDEEKYVLTQAYIPEHTVGLMTYLSGAEPFLVEDYFCCHKAGWVVLIGYPLRNEFNRDSFEGALNEIKKRFRPRYLSLIAPELPSSLSDSCRESDRDQYYTLEAKLPVLRSAINRNIRQARKVCSLKRADAMTESHVELMQEFADRVKPPARVRELLKKMPGYVQQSSTCVVIEARVPRKNLTAFYIVELAAQYFANYIIGCYSKKNYVRGASDLLLYETIQLALESGKQYIHLGLGVNAGIRRFKKKWGGVPFHKYEMCELELRKPSILETIFAVKK